MVRMAEIGISSCEHEKGILVIASEGAHIVVVRRERMETGWRLKTKLRGLYLWR